MNREEAIEIIRKLYYDSLFLKKDKEAIETLIPELKESEDEMIRKDIIETIKIEAKEFPSSVIASKAELWLTWLEKQGEQKPVGGNERETEINLAEILKHYPRETELYSPLYGKLWLAEVDEKNEIITCYKHCLDEGCTRAILEQEDTVSFYSNGTTGLPDYTISKDCMLFLYDIEKQNEQNPADKVEPKFRVGDWIIKNDDSSIIVDYSCCEITKVENGNYTIESIYGYKGYNTFETFEKDYHLWTIQDAKDGDVIVTKKGNPFLYDKNRYNNELAYYYVGLDANKELVSKSHHSMLNHFGKLSSISPATKEQRDLLFQKMKEAGYEWDSEKKELKKIE